MPEVILYASDWQGDYCDTFEMMAFGKAKKGYWDVEIENSGDYRVELSRWPFEANKTLCEGLIENVENPTAASLTTETDQPYHDGKNMEAKGGTNSALPIAKAQLQIANYNQMIDTKPEDKVAAFTIHLDAGKTKLAASFMDKDGKILRGAYYVRVTRLN